MDYYDKIIGERELFFNRLLIGTDIIPSTQILEYVPSKSGGRRGYPTIGGTRIRMRKYPTTVGEYVDNLPIQKIPPEIESKMIDLLNKIHQLGILHGDAHSYNFVLDTTGDVRLIDLGESYLFSEINNEVLVKLSEFWQTPIKSLTEAIEFENIMHRMDYK